MSMSTRSHATHRRGRYPEEGLVGVRMLESFPGFGVQGPPEGPRSV